MTLNPSKHCYHCLNQNIEKIYIYRNWEVKYNVQGNSKRSDPLRMLVILSVFVPECLFLVGSV